MTTTHLRSLRAKKSITDDEGFTLIELLVAIFLFGVVMVALAGVFIASAQSIADQRLRTAATRVATDHLERLRILPFEQLEAQAGQKTVETLDGRTFTIDTVVESIDAATGALDPAGRVKQIRAIVSWLSGAVTRQAEYSTGVAPPRSDTVAPQVIGTVTMFPNPAVSDGTGQPLADVEVTVPLEGFPAETLVHLSWTNADGTAGAQTLTTTSGVNWRETIPKEQVGAAIGADGRGEVEFTVVAGDLITVYTLAVQTVVLDPPVIIGATIDRNPILVTKPTGNRTCADNNRCQNTADVSFAVVVTGLDPTQDSVIVQYQLHDGTFQELPFTPPAVADGPWLLTVRARTTKFLVGTGRPFRFSAIRTSDGAVSSFTVERDVVTT